MVDNGAKRPQEFTELLYLPRSSGGRGLKSVEAEHEITKIKAAVNIYDNTDPTMELLQEFKEKAA